jgi:hypothetical protein
MRTHLSILLSLLAAFSAGASGQDTRTVSLGQRNYDVFDLHPMAPAHSYPFQVGSATRLVVDARGADAAVDMTLVDPLGATRDSGSFDRFTIDANDAPPLGAILFEPGQHLQAVIDNPPAGTWTLTVSLPAGGMSTLGSITTVATGGAGATATTSRPVYQADQPVVLALVAFDGSAPITGAQVTAKIYQTGAEMSPLAAALVDDGIEPDAQAADGIYSTSIVGLSPGHYLAEVTLQSAAEHLTAGADFEVVANSAHLSGTRSDNGVDTDQDGLFDRIDLGVGVVVDTAGVYDVLAELRTAAGGVVRGAARATLAAGMQTAMVPFAAADLRRYLAADGPWRIRNVRLLDVPTNAAAPGFLADSIDDLGLTGAYALAQLQRPITLIVPGITESATDTNGNGLFDQLSVSFQIDTRSAGFYTWTGDLRAADGTVLGVASNQGFLNAGVSQASFSFEGRPIGASNLDGPYTVGNVAVYGPVDAAAVADEVGRTRAYLASQFEGGEVAFARLIDEVNRLVITGIGGIPHAQGIRTSLLHKAENAQDQAGRGHTVPAAHMLEAFINEVQAQSGIHLAAADADRLVALATQLHDGL